MARHDKYPEEVAAFMAEHSMEYSTAGMAEELQRRYGFCKPVGAIRSYYKNHHLHALPVKGRRRPWLSCFPDGMREYLEEIAPGRTHKELASMINSKYGDGTITLLQLRAFMKNHKITTGLTGRFYKGQKSWSKGLKIEQIIKDPEKRRQSAKTRFKAGHVPANQLQVGAVVKSADGYLLRKKSMEGSQWERWEPLHRAVWEEHNGPIPEGMLVAFKDGDKCNCDIENLMLIDRSEHALLTTLKLRTEDPDLTDAGLKVVKIIKRRRDLQKKH